MKKYIFIFIAIIMVFNSSCKDETCSDGEKNQGEEQVDCGGPCPDCVVPGCTEATAHNYNVNATEDDGSCLTCGDGVMNGDEIAIDCGGSNCDACIEGCMDEDAHNYNPSAQVDNGSCITCFDGIQNGSETGVDCGGPICVECGTELIEGCTDEAAHNYNSDANWDDDSCETCTDGMINGDEEGVDCGGTNPNCPGCIVDIEGCTDADAHNYNAAATADDGSCETCADGMMNGDETGVDCGGNNANCPDCPIDDIEGCTDMDAHNFNASATIDDGSCETCDDGVQNGDETGVDCGGTFCNVTCNDADCNDPFAHNYNENATGSSECETCFDGIQNGDEQAIDCNSSNVNCEPCQLGCMDTDAHNFDPDAELDAGNCETCDDGELNGDEEGVDCGGSNPNCAPCNIGCIDAAAHNFDPMAQIGDDSCETCYDGIMNGDETGMDCGGSNNACVPCEDIEGPAFIAFINGTEWIATVTSILATVTPGFSTISVSNSTDNSSMFFTIDSDLQIGSYPLDTGTTFFLNNSNGTCFTSTAGGGEGGYGTLTITEVDDIAETFSASFSLYCSGDFTANISGYMVDINY